MVDESVHVFANFARSTSNKHRVLQADCNGLINTVSRNLEFTFRALSSTERATTVKFKGGVEKKQLVVYCVACRDDDDIYLIKNSYHYFFMTSKCLLPFSPSHNSLFRGMFFFQLTLEL